MRGMKAGKGLFEAAICVLIVWSLVLCARTATANTITIDAFTVPNPGEVFFLDPTGTGNTFVHQEPATPGAPDAAEILGGQRDVLVKVDGTALPISAAGIIGYETVNNNGLLQVATFGNPGSYVIAQYDGRDVEPDPPGDYPDDAEDLGLVDLTDGGANDRFLLSFKSLDAGNVTALTLGVKVVGNTAQETLYRNVTESSVPFDVPILFSGFSTTDLMKSVRSLTFEFNTPFAPTLNAPVPNVDFELDSIEAVPEPSTLAMLLALGVSVVLTGVWCRRKR